MLYLNLFNNCIDIKFKTIILILINHLEYYENDGYSMISAIKLFILQYLFPRDKGTSRSLHMPHLPGICRW